MDPEFTGSPVTELDYDDDAETLPVTYVQLGDEDIETVAVVL